jgi:hypothetical protein
MEDSLMGVIENWLQMGVFKIQPSLDLSVQKRMVNKTVIKPSTATIR